VRFCCALTFKTEVRRCFFNNESINGPLGSAFAALAAKLQNREADLAWPERSKGTKVPAYEEEAFSLAFQN
jgi:hypothetical protein